MWDDSLILEQTNKPKRNKLSEHELEELRDHIDLIPFDIGKVYRHAKNQSKREYKQARHKLRRKIHHSYNDE